MNGLSDSKIFTPHIAVFRHADSRKNLGLYDGFAQGTGYLPEGGLTQDGILYAEMIGERFSRALGYLDGKSVSLYVSPLTRTKETLETICKKLGIPFDNVIVDKRLLEIHNGEWIGKSLIATWGTQEYRDLGDFDTFFSTDRAEIGGFGPFFRCPWETKISDMYDLKTGKIKDGYMIARRTGSTSHADVFVAANSWLNEMFGLNVDYVLACSHAIPCRSMLIGRGNKTLIEATQNVISRLENGESIYDLRREKPELMILLGTILSTDIPTGTYIEFISPKFSPFPRLRIPKQQ